MVLWEATAIIYSSWSFALWKQAEIEAAKFRNSKGAGCKPKLSLREQMLLTLVYLSLHTFQYLGVQFGVSESTNNIFHYWLDIFTELLPASLEQVKKIRWFWMGSRNTHPVFVNSR